MYKLIFLFCCIFLFNDLFSQQVVFSNHKLNKTIVVKPGCKVFLGYKGYNGMQEFASNTVTDITDSTITLGVDLSFWFPNKKPNSSTNQYKIIRLSDITHFRKRSMGGELLKNAMQIGAALGSIYLLSDLYINSSTSRSNAILISAGVGVALNFTVKMIFPENAKYRMKDGWTINVKPNELRPVGRN
jgi:hypothetical protein